MAQWFRVPPGLAEDQGFVPKAHIVAHNHLTPFPWDPLPSSGLCKCSTHVHILASNTDVHINLGEKMVEVC